RGKLPPRHAPVDFATPVETRTPPETSGEVHRQTVASVGTPAAPDKACAAAGAATVHAGVHPARAMPALACGHAATGRSRARRAAAGAPGGRSTGRQPVRAAPPGRRMPALPAVAPRQQDSVWHR